MSNEATYQLLIALLVVEVGLLVSLVAGGISYGLTLLGRRGGPKVLTNITAGITVVSFLGLGAAMNIAFHDGGTQGLVTFMLASFGAAVATTTTWVTAMRTTTKLTQDFDAINEIVALGEGIFDLFDDDKDHVISSRDLNRTAKTAVARGRVSKETVRWLQRNFIRVGHSTGSGWIITSNDPVFARSRMATQFSAWKDRLPARCMR